MSDTEIRPKEVNIFGNTEVQIVGLDGANCNCLAIMTGHIPTYTALVLAGAEYLRAINHNDAADMEDTLRGLLEGPTSGTVQHRYALYDREERPMFDILITMGGPMVEDQYVIQRPVNATDPDAERITVVKLW